MNFVDNDNNRHRKHILNSAKNHHFINYIFRDDIISRSITIIAIVMILSSTLLPLYNYFATPDIADKGEYYYNSNGLLYTQSFFPKAYAANLLVRISQTVFVAGDELEIYGKSSPKDILLVTLYDPTGRAAKIDTIPVDSNGIFRQTIFRWPEPSRNLVFGNYVVQVTSSKSPDQSAQIQIIFAESVNNGSDNSVGSNNISAAQHVLQVKLDSPDQVATGKSFRIFVQVTFDGALLHSDDPEFLLGSSHVHSGSSASDANSTISLSNKFHEIHDGLYYADVTVNNEDTYIIHAIAFYKGFLSHDSRVITASYSSIGSIQDSVNLLSQKLNNTATELDLLEARLSQTQSTLNDTRNSITKSLDQARDSIKNDIGEAKQAVNNMEDASGQVNSIFLPVLALISVIIALQISLFARIRASYR